MNTVAKSVKNHFIPNPENDYKPQVLRPRIVAFVVMVVMVGELAFVFGSTYLIPSSKLYGVVEANALIDETNQNRASNNLPTLQVNPLLQAAAQEKANDMASKGYFAHTSPQGVTPWYWFENVGYSFDYAGENLAVNFTDSQDVTNAWMNSEEHRANILSGDFTQIGIATAQGIYNGQSATYVVEEFGTPAPVSAPVAFVNTADAASAPTSAPIPTVAVAPTSARVPAAQNKTISKAVAISAPKKSTPQTISKPVSSLIPVVPTVIAMQNSTDTNSAHSFVAVRGAQVQAVTSTAIPTSVVTSTGAGAVTPAASAIGLTQPQSNWFQRLSSDPREVANDFYLLVIALFGIASLLNFFIKIRIQYPRLIASGLVVIVISGICIILNQNIGLLHAAVL
jgi:hypothetical protein